MLRAGDDFYVFFHELRGQRLASVPRGADTVLSAGSAGAWYFDWFAERYGPVERHIGVEAFAPKPEKLPSGVEWIPSTIGTLREVGDEEVGLVFAGQVIEHVQPTDLVGFLCEAHRVLEPGGRLVVDSPNSRITRALGWEHPEHVIEFTVDEIVALVEVAGFREIAVFGVWLCYDRDRHVVLPLDPASDTSVSRGDRASLAVERPEDSFIWWLEATRRTRRIDRPRLTGMVSDVMVRDRLLRAIRRVS